MGDRHGVRVVIHEQPRGRGNDHVLCPSGQVSECDALIHAVSSCLCGCVRLLRTPVGVIP
ncbi:hypothetical protein HWB05_gp003 [Streptomyces phage BRock]|uniref:Uncharacterized protein n=1 Tax=Streptomyces phage BRock TaxID=1913591 RepID=A0A1J0GVQ5_9CAUD|nr:hypothetical protein HWB05_gp003 [Streptomyces phage BRock]APC46265.1 hypothetical protein [Streptomyces phage BRock]